MSHTECDQLTAALERSRALLDRLSGAPRSDLIDGLQDLSEVAAATLQAISDASNPPDSDWSDGDPSDGDLSNADPSDGDPPGPAAPADTE
ncbi:MAG: hypothetical protein WCD11_23670 [Solirubrobacteraceae bacterium]